MPSTLFNILGVDPRNKFSLRDMAKSLGITVSELKYYNSNHILPSSVILEKINVVHRISQVEIMLSMGLFDHKVKELLSSNASSIANILPSLSNSKETKELTPSFTTNLGSLYQADCLDLMSSIEDNSVDLVFADPPFNLKKLYPSNIDDNLKESEYITWCEEWLSECVRILKDGGSLFLWNLPKWNTYFSDYLNNYLQFKHWIATDIKYSLPISGRLYPSHYSLLYYVKGAKANAFHPDRLPMEVCNKCHREIKDYGGYKNKMNPKGINMSDVWYDIPPVRHTKYKNRKDANELSVKLLDRIIEMSSNPGDVVFDPFGGAGTTYVVSEIKNRKWIGVELGPVDIIIDRFKNIDSDANLMNKYRESLNVLFPSEIKKKRHKKGIWTDDTFSNEMNKSTQKHIFDSDD